MRHKSLLVAATLAVASVAVSAQVNPSLLAGLQWRNIGAFRAGRAGAVCGVAGHPGTYYIGAMQGGFWKTVSAGAVWFNLTDTTVPDVAAITACAVAPSAPDEVFFSSNARGPGMFRSADAGKSWTKVGPVAATIYIDPRDAKLVLVARAGAGGGVFRSTDGGLTFTKAFARDDASGVNTLQYAYDTPNVIYASVGGAGGRGGGGGRGGRGGAPASGPTFFKSTDTGLTWTPVAFTGVPAIGQFTVAGATHGQRLYTTAGRSGLFRSDDGGATWTQGASQLFTATGAIYADPQNPDMVYLLGTAVYRSTDGGKTIAPFKGSPGGDDPREWWIDGTDGRNILYGGDQGASVSLDAGYTWSPWYNQPTAQLYHLTVDDRFPYWVYGSQQDSGTVAARSRGDFGQINSWDWMPFPGWEGATLAVDPLNPNLVYTNGNYGDLGRVWLDTWDSQVINPAMGHEVMHRNSNSPILFSPLDPHTLYFVTQYVMATHDAGQTFEKISPDLTVRPGEAPAAPAAGRGGARGGGNIGSFAVSPVKAGVMWAAASTGLLWMTADGKNWQNITPADWQGGAVSMIEASHFDANTAYVALDRNGGGGGGGFGAPADSKPYFYRTRDGGKSWQLIVTGLPTDESTGSFARVIREDPKQRGLLFAGTETQVHVSFDDGDHWQSLRLNAPNTSWRDLVIHGNDLVAATYGRSFWVLDDIAPLRTLAAQAPRVAAAPAYLFPISTAVRLQRDNNFDTPLPPEVPHAQNPPEGAIFYYNLAAPAAALKIEIRDAQNRLVRTLGAAPDFMPVDELGAVPEPWKRVPTGLPTAAGMHRVTWDLRWSSPNAISYNYDQEMSAIYHDTPAAPQGAKALPGAYTVKLTVNGTTYTQPLTVIEDPRLAKTATLAGMQKQLALELLLTQGINQSKLAYDQIAAVRAQIKAQGSLPANQAAAATALDQQMSALQGEPREAQSDVYGTVAGNTTFAHLNGVFTRFITAVDYNSDMPPVAGQVAGFQEFCADYNGLLARWKSLLANQLPAARPALKLPTSTPQGLSCDANTK